MQILNKYKRWNPQILLKTDEIWDFVLSQDTTPSIEEDNILSDDCLISFIDTNKEECLIENNYLLSSSDYKWENGKNDGPTLEDIGYTGVDNGLLLYEKDKISNLDFYKIFTKSKLHLKKDNLSLILHPVSGNTGLYSYPYEIQANESEKFISLKGGFYQGFYKLYGFNYEVLPNTIEDYWGMEFVLRPKQYEEEKNTLNNTYPENKGIFFYMGTRAENKFLQGYGYDFSSFKKRIDNRKFEFPEDCQNFPNESYFLEDYLDESENTSLKPVDNDCFKTLMLLQYFMQPDEKFYCCSKEELQKINPIEEEEKIDCKKTNYFINDADLNNAVFETSNGSDILQEGYYEIETDNKYLIFNQTKTGFTTDTWDDNNKFVLTGTTLSNNANLYLLLNNTKTGYTTDTIENYYTSVKKDSSKIFKDSIGNCFALKINDNGSIGYRYMIDDCENANGYKVIEEQSFPNIIKNDEWNTIFVSFQILNGELDKCNNPIGKRKMKIYIYVNGKLKFISKELPDFNFRQLDETKEKQEGVPYNISLGGGTQGLCDSIWLNYYDVFKPILPIEENFAGTFIGDFKSFKFYNCLKEYQEIKNNYLYEQKL